MRSLAANVMCCKLGGAFACVLMSSACVAPQDAHVSLATHGNLGIEDVVSVFGAAVSGTGTDEVTARSADVELRLDADPFQVILGQEWSDHGVATDSYLTGLRWYPFSSDSSPGPFFEGVAKIESDENGGSSLVDGVELRFGAGGTVWSRVGLEAVAAVSYFDSSKQDGQPGHVYEFRVGIGLRFGLW